MADKEYIEREAVIDALYDNEFQTFCPLDEVSGVIDIIHAADVQEVRHGEWAINQDDLYWGNFLVKMTRAKTLKAS